jgi:protein-disulfide isomerase
MAQDSGAQRRAEAAALKAEASAAAKRDQRIKIIGGIAVAVVVVGIVLAGYLGARSSTPKADANAAQPIGTVAKTYGFPVKPIDPTKSTLVIWEDPQCPICKLFETQYGATVLGLVDSGTINAVYSMANFIDDNLPQSKHASRRAVAAFGCAIDQGVGLQYHTLIYATQPGTEGDGWTDAALRALGAHAGLIGTKLSAFQSCFDSGKYLGWSDNLGQLFRDNQIPGTPNLILDGTTVPDTALSTVKTFTDYIHAHAK